MYPDWSNGQVYTYTSHKSGFLGYFQTQATLKIITPETRLKRFLLRGVDAVVCVGVPFLWLFSHPIYLTLEEIV
jgi:hypothetical protein